ncbi:MAG TPA: nuclear transport factor 2 family protein [Gemmatimonadaceae bacterium]|jgi:ketosteroid isomerase-like protein|nr:nuclear transport factor 2 family protein [Gemmatimonadaceae bacterium]
MGTTTTPTTTAAVAEELVSFCKARDFTGAINNLYSPNIVSVESMGNETMPREMKGIDAIRGKNQWWADNHEVHSTVVDGPFVGEDKFAVYYNFDVTFKPTGKRTPMEEMALYEVKDGKIVREQFFYRTS